MMHPVYLLRSSKYKHALQGLWSVCRRIDVAAAFGSEPDVFDVF